MPQTVLSDLIRGGAGLPSLALFVALTVGAASPRQSQTPQFRSRADLVQVDVIAVDKDGNPVQGLTQTDFSVLDRGKPQTIAMFDEVTHERASRAPAAAPALPVMLKRDVSSNQTAAAKRLIVMVVDDLHIYKGRTDRAKEIANEVVAELGPEASMAVLFASGEHSIEVTEDRSELVRAIDFLRGRRPYPRPTPASDNPRALGVDLQEFEDNMTTYKTVQDAARMLGAGDVRRKAFVFVSEGVGKDLSGIFDAMAPPGPPPGATLKPQYHDFAIIDMMESLRRSNVVVYSIDPRGFVSSEKLMAECHPGGGADDPCVGGGLPVPPDWGSWVRQAQHGLEMTSEATGGFAVTNTDDFTRGLNRILNDLDHYYLLGFYPEDPRGKGYHKLDVKATRPGVTLRFRHGYQAGGPPPLPKNKDPLVALSAGVIPQTDLAMRLGAFPRPATTAGAKASGVSVALEVTLPRKDLTPSGGPLRDSLHYTVLAANVKSGKVAAQFSNTSRLSDRAPGNEMSDSVVVQIPIELTLPPGRYQLRASAISEAVGKGGSVYLALEVPVPSASLTLGAPMIGYADAARVVLAPGPAPARGAKPPAAAASTFVPTLDREFKSSDVLQVGFEVARRDGSTIVETTTAMVDGTDRVVRSVDHRVPANVHEATVRLPLDGLPSGSYRIRVSARDGAMSVNRDVGFAIR